MGDREINRVACQICHQIKPISELQPAETVHQAVIDTIKGEHPEWTGEGYICLNDLNHYRTKHIKEILEHERGELTELESEVARSLAEHELLSRNVNDQFTSQLTLGERIADRVASFGGSWRFIIIFASILFIWIVINTIVLIARPFDPYPFILLNLMLSCLAAIQAPIIMMSQNRQEAKDRLRAEHDFKINLKAELEIRHLNEKLDHLISHQWQNLLETQEMQMEMLNEIMAQEEQAQSGEK
ncbi:MAG TPA: hypothetical protein DCM45_07130 [Clostridiales bacterium]|nr:hypothetical protein [Clostridiales bacterium]